MDTYSILVARIVYDDGSGSKIRPAIVVKFDNEIIRTYKITSQFEKKSEEIKKHYFEIIDWYKASLKKPSWIDTIKYYDLDSKGAEFKIIGHLSDRDVVRLIEFLKEK